MDPVDLPRAIASISAFSDEIKAAEKPLGKNRMIRWIKGMTTWRETARELQQHLNRIVEHMANTTSHSVITCINQYPYDITPAVLPKILKVNEQLLYLLNKEQTINKENDNNDEPENKD